MRKDYPLATKEAIIFDDLLDIPIFCSEQSAKMDLPRWCSDNLDRLNILATFNLCNNGAVFVREGLGVELTFDKLVETNAESDLCFRPITPPLHTKMYVIWKKYQIFHISLLLSPSQPAISTEPISRSSVTFCSVSH